MISMVQGRIFRAQLPEQIAYHFSQLVLLQRMSNLANLANSIAKLRHGLPVLWSHWPDLLNFDKSSKACLVSARVSSPSPSITEVINITLFLIFNLCTLTSIDLLGDPRCSRELHSGSPSARDKYEYSPALLFKIDLLTI